MQVAAEKDLKELSLLRDKVLVERDEYERAVVKKMPIVRKLQEESDAVISTFKNF